MKTKEIALKDIKPGPFHYRDDLDRLSVEDLAKSIKTEGMINPLTVRTNGKGYELVCGHRRFLALKHLKRDMADCRVIEATDREARKMAIAENFAREDLCPLEKTEAVAEWVDAYLDEHCEGYPGFLRELRDGVEAKKKQKGGHPSKPADFAKAKGRVNFLLSLAESDRKNNTQLVSNTVVANLSAAFSTLPKPINETSYAVHDLPFVMALEDAPDVRTFSRERRLNKSKIKALLELRHRGETDAKSLETFKDILKTGEVAETLPNGHPTGKRLAITSGKIKATTICPKKPTNKTGGVRDYKTGEVIRNGKAVAKNVVMALDALDPRDEEFDQAYERILEKLERIRKQHAIIIEEQSSVRK